MNGSRAHERDAEVRAYAMVVRDEGVHPRPGNLCYGFDRLLGGIDLTGKRVLEIGGGAGTLSFYVAVHGAREVVCLEPEGAGATTDVTERFKRLSERLRLPNVRLETRTFQDYEPKGSCFDLLVLNNSINHLEERACADLRHDASARSIYQRLFEKMHRLSRPGGVLVISDCSRYNAFGLLGLRNPFMPTIEWQKHQAPGFWARLISGAGFGRARIRWSSFNSLRGPGRVLLANPVAAFLLTSHFTLRMVRT